MFVAICASPEASAILKAAGADGVEGQAVGLFQPLEPHWQPPGPYELPMETTNVFFPGEVKLFGEGPDPIEVGRRAIERAAPLGVKVMVLGSGGSRRAPEGVDPDVAEGKFAEVAGKLHAIAAAHGLAVAPEPLNVSETNVGNAPGPLAQLLRTNGAPYTTDSYHVLWHHRETEPDRPLDDYLEEHVPFLPVHVHLSGADRLAPRAEDPQMIAFARRLKTLGYTGRVSLECGWGDMASEAPDAIRAVRALFA